MSPRMKSSRYLPARGARAANGAVKGVVTPDEVVGAEVVVAAVVAAEEVVLVGLGALLARAARPAPWNAPEPLSSRLDGSSPKATHPPRLG